MAHFLITGANGHLGRRLIPQLLPAHKVTAVVRSARAAAQLQEFENEIHLAQVSYTDASGLKELLHDVDYVVHLVGIIKATPQASYESAHEDTCEVLADICAETGVGRIVYLSIVGSDPGEKNDCLRSKGRAEQILLSGSTQVTVIQVPMVLGEGDFASAALKRNASKGIALTFRASSMEQPIYAGDVIDAVLAVTKGDGNQHLQLAGPESLSRRELITRASAVLGNSTRVISLPIGLGLVVAGLAEKLASPPVTRAMLEVLDHDDIIDPQPVADALGIKLTGLDDMLALVLA